MTQVPAVAGATAPTKTYQWYADGVAINGATSDSYVVTKDVLGKAINVVVTTTADSATYKSAITAKVVADTTPAAIKVTGMTTEATYNKTTGALLTAGTPTVGNTLTVSFTAPTGAADAKAKYQWYRVISGTEYAIAGATASTYTVQADDETHELIVKVTLSDSAKVLSFTTGTVAKDLSKATVATSKVTATTAGQHDAFAVSSVKVGETNIASSNYDVKWYIDNVSDANLLYTNASSLTAASSIAADGEYYTAKDASAATIVKNADPVKLAGHKLVAEVVGKSLYTGKAQSAATDAVTIAASVGSISVDTGTTLYAGRTTLKAITTPADASVTYQWYKSVDGAAWTAISGATSKTYEPTAAEATEGDVHYQVTIASTSEYAVLDGHKTVATTGTLSWAGSYTDAVTVSTITLENTTSKTRGTSNIAQPGDVLKVSCDIAKAESSMKYTWTYHTASVSPDATYTGSTFTVPATAKASDTISVAVESTSASYVILSGTSTVTLPATVTVQGTYTKATLTSNGTEQAGGQITRDHVTYPLVGEKLTVATTPAAGAGATYQWYADGTAIDNATNSTYDIAAAQLGKKITCKVSDGTGFVGSTVATDATGVVTAVQSISVTGATKTAPITKGTTLTASVPTFTTSDDINMLTFTWTLTQNGKVMKTVTGTGVDYDQYKVDPSDVGYSLSVTVSANGLTAPTGGSLTWTNTLAIQ